MTEVNSEYAKVLKLFNPPKNLTFLVGAGCSFDSPTNIPCTREIMDTIIEYICVNHETSKIKGIKKLRFEALIEVFGDMFDPNLRIIDYFELFKEPNAQHYFLAEMIKRDNFVMTTNFDFLIEYALRESGIRKSNIKIVISKREFEKYANPTELVKKGKMALYKIHGSTKNIITGKKRRDSLITTIQALGSNKNGADLFSIEAFKKPLFDNISKDRTLVIMGYSGSDDFDIVPTLKRLTGLRSVVWINHISDNKGKITVQEINNEVKETSGNNDNVYQILREILEENNSVRIVRVDANASDLICFLNQYFGYNYTSKSLSLQIPQLKSWMKNRFPIQKKEEFYIKNLIPTRIYLDFNESHDVIRCANEIIKKARECGDTYWEGIASFFLGRIYRNKHNTPLAEEYFTRAKQKLFENRNIEEKGLRKIRDLLKDLRTSIRNPRITFRHLHSIRNIKSEKGLYYLYRVQIEYANVRANQGKYREAIPVYLNILREFSKKKKKETRAFKELKALCYGYLGNAYRNLGIFTKSFNKYNRALKIFEEIGNIRDQGVYKHNLGLAYRDIGQFRRQIKEMEDSLRIGKMISDDRCEIKAKGGIASANGYLGNLEKAIIDHKKSIKEIKKEGGKLLLGYLQEDYAKTEMFSQNYEFARENYEEALKNTNENHSLLLQKRNTYIGLIFLLESELEKACEYIKEALKHEDSDVSLVIKSFTYVIEGIIKARKNERLAAKKSFLTTIDLANKQLSEEERDYFTYSNKIVSLIGMILISETIDMDNTWEEKIKQHNISIQCFESIGQFKEFSLLCETLTPINQKFVNSKIKLFEPRSN